MRYEKTSDMSQLREPISLLLIPGEGYYRLWEAEFGPRDEDGGVRRGVPERSFGLEGVLLQIFIRLKELDAKIAVAHEVYRTFLALVTTNAHKDATVDPKQQELVMTMMWYWQRLVDPSSIRPQSERSDELVQKMEAYKHVFDSSAGFEVMAGPERPDFLS